MDAPQITPDLAGKVLAAEVRDQMQAGALTPETAAQQRAAALLAKFCSGQDLTPSQWEEVRAFHPNFARHPAPPSGAAQDAEAKQTSAAAPRDPAPHRAVKLTKQNEARYGRMYKKGWRQIRRWIEKGEKAGDPCPLEDPVALMRWWPRHNKWRVPPEIEEAAVSASRPGPAPTDQEQEPAGTIAHPPSPAPGVSAPNPGQAIDLESFDPEEGDRLRELKQIQAAKFLQLKHALKLGEDCTLLETKYLKLSETIDKIETRVTERLRKRGLYLPRESIERDLAAAAELLRQSRESMVRRVLELCPSLGEVERAEVAAAIERARASEERMLVKLESLTADDLLRELAA